MRHNAASVKEQMALFGFGSGNKYVDELTMKIDVAQMERDKMIFNQGVVTGQIQICQNELRQLRDRKAFLKSNDNVIVEMTEYRQLVGQIDLLAHNELVLEQHLENFQTAIERCKKHIENLTRQREKSEFKVLEFKRRDQR